jgi:hypothetical protein
MPPPDKRLDRYPNLIRDEVPYHQGGAVEDLFKRGSPKGVTVIVIPPTGREGGDANIPMGAPFEWGGNIAPDGRGDDNMPLGHDDCSSFIANLIAQLTGDGIRLPALTNAQVDETDPVHPGDEQPGDLAFSRYEGQGPIDWGHVGMYMGDDKVLDQSTSSDGPSGQPGIDIRPVDHAMDQGGELMFRRIPGLSDRSWR